MISPKDYQEAERWLRDKIILARNTREVAHAATEAIDWIKGERIEFEANKDVALEDLKRIGLGTFQGLARTDVELRRISVIPTVLSGDGISVNPFGLIEINSSLLGPTGRKMEASEIEDTFKAFSSMFAPPPQNEGSKHHARARAGFPELGAGALAVAGVGELAFKQRTQEDQKIFAGEIAETLGTRAGQEPAKILGKSLVTASYSQPEKGIDTKFTLGGLNPSPNNTALTALEVLDRAGSFSDAATLQYTARESRHAMEALSGRNVPGRPYPRSVPTMEPLPLERPAPGGRRILGLSQDQKLGR